MEMVPGDVAAQVTKELAIPTIGIGAGIECDGQVLVWQDAFGLRTGRMATFVKQYADVHGVLLDAARAYADDVRTGTFPGPGAHLLTRHRLLRSQQAKVLVTLARGPRPAPGIADLHPAQVAVGACQRRAERAVVQVQPLDDLDPAPAPVLP